MGIRIITDSTSYLPAEKIEEFGIEVVPLEISFQGEAFREGDIRNREYYSRLRRHKDFPTTSQPPAGDFVEAFKKCGPRETCLCLVLSELLSGTFQSAETAAGLLPDYDITVMDSRSTAMGLGFQVLKAAEMAAEGWGRDEIITELVKVRSAVRVFFMVDNLEYLVRGGRLGKASGLLGNLLQVKPILGVVDGRIEPVEKVRSKGRAVKHIVQVLREQVEQGSIAAVAAIHADNESEALELKAQVAEFYPGPILLSEVGPTIGSHVGPGALGLIYY